MIEPLPPADIPRAVALIRASFITVADELGLTAQNCPTHTAFSVSEEKLRRAIGKGTLPFGLYEGGLLVGYVALTKSGRRAYKLDHLAVLPEYRHRGYGRQLLDFCKGKAKALKAKKLTLGMIDENTKLKDWYAANGFVHTGTKKIEGLPFTPGYMEYIIHK